MVLVKLMAKDGAHYPTKQFSENFDRIFRTKKKAEKKHGKDRRA